MYLKKTEYIFLSQERYLLIRIFALIRKSQTHAEKMSESNQNNEYKIKLDKW